MDHAPQPRRSGANEDASPYATPEAPIQDTSLNGYAYGAALGALRVARRVAVGVIGSTVVAIGVAMLVLPGPGLVVIPIGLGILGIEFAFARRWLARLRDHASEVAAKVSASVSSSPPSGAGNKPKDDQGAPR
jgi:hypothetical protein